MWPNLDDITHFQFVRGNAITQFAGIESAIENFIADHYIKDRASRDLFHHEVLQSPQFSFELKKRIMTEILKTHYPEVYKDFPSTKLKKLQEYRNIIAHGAHYGLYSYQEMYFKHGGKEYVAKELVAEYSPMAEEVMMAMMKINQLPTSR